MEFAKLQEYCDDKLNRGESCHFPRLTAHERQPAKSKTNLLKSSLCLPGPLADAPHINYLLKTAWALILGVYSGRDDICFAEIDYVGHDRGYETLNIDVANIAAVDTVYDLVQKFENEAKSHSLPSWKIAEIGTEHNVYDSVTRLCNSVLIWGDIPQAETEPITNAFDICIQLSGSALAGNGTVINIDLYAQPSLLDDSHAARLAATLSSALQAVHANLKQSVDALDILSDEERLQIAAWNKEIPEASNLRIHDLFEQMAREHSSDQAIAAWDGDMTYGLLDELSSSLANHLAGRGIGAGHLVPLCFEKSKWIPVAMLAVLKTGAAFTTLDPGHPTNRLESMMIEVQATAVLVASSQSGRFNVPNIEIITDIPDKCHHRQGSTHKLSESVTPDDLALAVFTSGSTGTPKAILHSHSGAAGLLLTPESGYEPGCRILQFASQVFVLSTWEILKTLCHGSCICIPSEQDRSNNITRFISDQRVTRAFLTPSFLKTIKPEDVPTLDILIVGGELVPPDLIKTWSSKLRLVENYGMSEGLTIYSEIDGTGLKSRSKQTVNGAAWLTYPTDPHRLVPIGAIGMLHIEANFLFKRYMHHTAQTESVFLQNPAWAARILKRPLAPIFKTGDLARYTSDGVLQIVGRGDFLQVKINGQRIELEDIEAHMAKFLSKGTMAIAEVVTPADGNGRAVLVGFISINQNELQDSKVLDTEFNSVQSYFSSLTDKLRTGLAAELPAYMVPSAFLLLDKLPMNTSFKLDRKQLRQMGSQMTMKELILHDTMAERKEMPATHAEEVLQRLWATVLKLDIADIGMGDNFFMLGGDSLTAIKLIAAARDQNIRLPIQSLLTTPILREMAKIANVLGPKDEVPETSSLTQYPRPQITDEIRALVGNHEIEDIVEATDFQAWSIFTGTLESRGWHNYLNFDLHGHLDVARLIEACRRFLDSHTVLRTVFIVSQQRTLQVVLKHYPLIFEAYSCTQAESIEVATQAFHKKDLAVPWSLGDPITKFMLLKKDELNHRLIVRMSHAQYDASTFMTIWASLKAAYAGPIAKGPNFGRFCDMVKLHEHESEQFWRKKLAGSEITQVFADSTTNYGGDVINDSVIRPIEAPALQKYGITLATILSATWALVLSALSGHEDVVFSSISRGRHLEFPDIESLLGACVSLLPVRLKVQPTDTVLSFLTSAQNSVLETLPHENFGFTKIIKRCTDWSPTTRFSTLMNPINFSEIQEDRAFSDHLSYKFSQFEPLVNKADLYMVTKQNQTTVEVDLRFCNTLIEKEKVEKILQLYCETVQNILGAIESPVSELTDKIRRSDVRLPLQKKMESSSRMLQVENSLVVKAELRTKVLQIWGKVVGDVAGAGVSGLEGDNIPYYMIWADPICASALSLAFKQGGLDLSVEEILDNPTVEMQLQLLSRNPKQL